MRLLSFLVIALAFIASPAEARKHHTYRAVPAYTYAHPQCNILFPCEGVVRNVKGDVFADKAKFGMGRPRYYHSSRVAVPRPSRSGPQQFVGNLIEAPIRVTRTVVSEVASVATQMLPHPAGCPASNFCGCGAAQEVGRSGDRSLWLAANWSKFPRATPAPGMAAYRSHHVFVLKQHVQGDVWIVADHNSGGHRSRLHARSISGYNIVNPS